MALSSVQKTAGRLGIYLMGMVVLALGITLSTRLDLGVSPITSVPYSISVIFDRSYGDITMLFYMVCVAAQMILHVCMHPAPGKLRSLLIRDALQLAVSYPVTRLMNLFTMVIPAFKEDLAGTFWGSISWRFFLLLVSIILVGLGAALTLSMRLIANPADGIVQVIADFTHKKLGDIKNVFDTSCVLITLILGGIGAHRIIGLGIGSILAMIGTGRVIAGVNKVFDPAPFIGTKQV
ncbi:MAG: DUF6198 family protein [Lachnospiraceae bacterium]|nr:DUF6198 family protein [Lachnospiraceae bacterium]